MMKAEMKRAILEADMKEHKRVSRLKKTSEKEKNRHKQAVKNIELKLKELA